MGELDKKPTYSWRIAGVWALRFFAIALTIATLLSMTDFNQWWIRIWDFPRLQMLIAMAAVGIAIWFFDRATRPWVPVLLAALIAWQAYRIHPYTPLAAAEVAEISEGDVDDTGCFTVLTLNVLQTNREYERTAELIERLDPEIVLLMETDQAWMDAMQPALAPYAHQTGKALDNKYGILFASKLPTREMTIQDLAQKDTPSIFATVAAAEHEFRVIGLHPRPPRPGQDTEERDAEIIVAAKRSQDTSSPVLAIGDFNDVAWSDTTQLFKNVGGFLDPRIGRGTFATFPADQLWLGWPLDHLFVTEEFMLAEMRVGEAVGSDHRPVIARLCLDPASAKTRNEETKPTSAADNGEAAVVMEEYEDDTAEDRIEGE